MLYKEFLKKNKPLFKIKRSAQCRSEESKSNEISEDIETQGKQKSRPQSDVDEGKRTPRRRKRKN